MTNEQFRELEIQYFALKHEIKTDLQTRTSKYLKDKLAEHKMDWLETKTTQDKARARGALAARMAAIKFPEYIEEDKRRTEAKRQADRRDKITREWRRRKDRLAEAKVALEMLQEWIAEMTPEKLTKFHFTQLISTTNQDQEFRTRAWEKN